MKIWILFLRHVLVLCLTATSLTAQAQEIDWNRARDLHRRSQSGETLSEKENAYLERARKLRANPARREAGNRETSRGSESVEQPSQHFTPLTELNHETYLGQSGGLYGDGANIPPDAHRLAALHESAKITPLDSDGRPAGSGKVVLLSIGMSNTTQEFSVFKRLADSDPGKASTMIIVDGAQGGQDAVKISDVSAKFWSQIDERLKAAGVTGRQVQSVWIKQAVAGPRASFSEESRRLQNLLGDIVRIAKQRYPNLQIVYLSSRIYAGYATSRLNPEPYAYQSAFAVRALIKDQMEGNPQLNFNSDRGAAKSPLLLWGPYLWADGQTPRKSDGLVWKREDLAKDGTHPSNSGRQKVAELLLKFFKTEPTAKSWFLRGKRLRNE